MCDGHINCDDYSDESEAVCQGLSSVIQSINVQCRYILYSTTDFFHPLVFAEGKKSKGWLGMKKREDLARGVVGFEFVHSVHSLFR